MRFKIGKTQIHITFSFAAGMVILSLLYDSARVFSVLAASVLHEFTHLVCFLLCKTPPETVVVGLYGMRMSAENMRCLSYKKECFCALCAPVCNLFLFLAGLPFWTVGPFWQSFCSACFSFGFFNLLPLRCLDGGRALHCLLLQYGSACKAEKVMNITEWLAFAGLFLFLIFFFFFIRFEWTGAVFLFYLSFLFLFRK